MNDKTRNQVLLVFFLGVLMGALDIAIVAPALPSIQAYFGVDDRAFGRTFSIYVLSTHRHAADGPSSRNRTGAATCTWRT